jgi:cell wall-associated NlpC family hydrolase
MEDGRKMHRDLLIAAALSLLVFGACAPKPRFAPEPVPERASPSRPEHGSEKSRSKIDRDKMGRIIDSFLGAPYEYGGEGKSGIDCSGLVRQVYRQYAGFNLPHDTKKLYQLVKQVNRDDLAYGDLVFFSDGWFSVSHVGIYLDDGKFVHASETSGVMVSSLDEEHFRKRYRGARRVIP